MGKRIALVLAWSALSAATAGCQKNRLHNGGHEVLVVPSGSVSVYQLAGRLGMTVEDCAEHFATLRDTANSVVIYPDPGGQVFVNGRPVAQVAGVTAVRGILFVPARLEGEIRPLLREPPPIPVFRSPSPAPSEQEPRSVAGCVVLDPGHGGRDPGAIGVNGLQEKDVNLAVARQVARRLQDRGVEVFLTRQGDSFLELEDRAAMANRLRPDLFVSLHADSAANGAASGFPVYVSRSAAGGTRSRG